MSFSRSALRVAAAVGATTALTLAGAGAASATTSKSATAGDTVSVTFALEADETGDTCGAALIPLSAGLTLLNALNGAGTLDQLLANADAFGGVQVLRSGASATVTLDADAPTATVTATDVPNGAYVLAPFCTSNLSELADLEDVTDLLDLGAEPVTVGSPFDIISGLSSGGGLDTFSSALGGGDENTGALGLGTLSSAFDGGNLAGE